jgi:lipopolysaccharide biosynthesis glycosyltransferase
MSSKFLNILVTINAAYMLPFKVMACSLVLNNLSSDVTFYLLHSEGLSRNNVDSLRSFCSQLGAGCKALQIDDSVLDGARTSKRYPKEMYFRLLAPRLINDVERIIYLDPDTLIINPLDSLVRLRLRKNACFAAACHTGVSEQIAKPINNVRLGTAGGYYNTGVIMMDLPRARGIVLPEDIFNYVSEHSGTILPDQDLFNALYGSYTQEVDDALWNYDPRSYSQYRMLSGGERDMDWVIANTSVIHFCGSRKPWRTNARTRLETLYAHYQAIERRFEEQQQRRRS